MNAKTELKTLSWACVPLETIVNPTRPITYGIVLPGPDVSDGVPYVRVVDIQDGTVRTEQLRRTTATIAKSYQRSELAEGDLLVSIRGHVGRTAVVPRLAHGANLTQDTARVAIGGDADPRFVRWFIESPPARQWMAQHTKGVAVTGINLGDLKRLPVPLPPYPEQQRIAKMLDMADAIRRKHQEATALTEQLLRSTFLEMFGDPITNPKRWPISPFGDVVGELRYGTSQKCSDRQEPGMRPVLRIPNIVAGSIDTRNLKYARLTGIDLEQSRLKDGDIIFVRSNGNPEYIGRCAVFHGEDDYAFASYLIRGRSRKNTDYSMDFAQAVMSYPSFRSQLIREARTTAGNYNISTEGLKNLRLIHPPAELQDAWLRQAALIAQLSQRYTSCLSEANNLFKSLVQRVFPGQL